MKDVTRNFVITILLFVFLLGAFSGILIPVVDAVNEMDTSVAVIENDTYKSYYDGGEFYDNFRSDIEAMGGYIYDSQSAEKSKNITTALDYEFKPVKQVITVMTTATGSKEHGNYVESKPLANAIVRLNGVPRYTDRNGQVRATLDREYVELFVEKNGYGPYIEIMEVTGENKTVNLKRENDDIDIYGVMLTAIEYNPVNLINSEYTIFPEALGDYIANMKFLVNINADRYMLLMEDKIIYSSNEDTIYDIDFTDDMEDKKFYAQVEYQGILSKPVALHLSISIPDFYKETDIELYSADNSNALNPFAGEDTSGIFSDFKFDFTKLPKLKDFLGNSKLNLAVNMRKGTITFEMGFEKDYFHHIQEGDQRKVEMMNNKIKDNKNRNKANKAQKDKCQEEVNKANANIQEAEQQKLKLQSDIKTQNNIISNLQSQQSQIKDNDTQEINRINELINVANNNISNLQNDIDNIDNDIIAKERSAISEYNKQIDTIQAQQKKDIDAIDGDIQEANLIIDKLRDNVQETDKKVEELTNKVKQGEVDLSNLDTLINNLGNEIKDIRNKYAQEKKSVSISFEMFGTIEYNFRAHKFSKAAVILGFGIRFSVQGKFMAGYVPIFYVISVNGKLKAEMNFYNSDTGLIDPEKFWEYLLMSFTLGFEVEVGAGINGFASVSVFAGADFIISGHVGFEEFWTHFNEVAGTELKLKVGIRLKALYVFSYEFGEDVSFKNRHYEIDQIYDKFRNNNTDSLALSAMLHNDNVLSNNIYDGSKPQVEKVGEDYIASWIDLEYKGNEPRTVLKYSIFQNGVWSNPKAVYNSGSDFYHDMYFDGQDLHIAWQNIKEGTDIASLEDTCQNSEIYYAKFNAEKLEFEGIERLTDNNSLDAAPKFVLQESINQPLTIVWQRNSVDNIFGLSGRNSIAYSRLNENKWDDYKIIYESNNYFSFVDTAYIDGELTSTFVEDMDNDLATDDRKIIVISEGEQCKIIGKDFKVVNNPQFFKIDGKVKLTFYADGNVRYTDDFATMHNFDIPNGKVNDTFKIMENDTNIYVYYYKVSADNSHQIFATIYDKRTGDWQMDVCLTSAKNKVSCPAISILPNGDILTVYNSLDKETEIVSLEYEIKQLRKDFEISYVFYDLDVKRGEKFDLNLIIKNTGDYPLKSLEISAFGITDIVVLEKVIEIGETETVKIERIFDINADGKEVIFVSFGGIIRQYTITTRFTDIAIDGLKKIDSYGESYNLILKNSSEEGSNIYLDIYYNGEITDTIEMFVEGISELQYTYHNNEFQNGKYIEFKVRTELKDKYSSDNDIGFLIEYMAQRDEVKTNPYFESMQIAKSL